MYMKCVKTTHVTIHVLLVMYHGKLAMKYGVTGHIYTPYVSPVSLHSGSPQQTVLFVVAKKV